jgi:amidase
MNATFYAAVAQDYNLSRTYGIDATLMQYNLDAILLPSNGQSLLNIYDRCADTFDTGYTTPPAAKAGYPIVTGIPSLDSMLQ